MLYISLKNGDFTRPDRYHSSLVIKKMLCDEKCSNEEMNLLLCQIVCELCCLMPENRPCFELDGNTSLAGDLAQYLSTHGMKARFYVRTDDYMSPDDVVKLCSRSTLECHISPLVDVTKNDKAFIKELAALYPIGAVGFYK